jgi:hypothetical protein
MAPWESTASGLGRNLEVGADGACPFAFPYRKPSDRPFFLGTCAPASGHFLATSSKTKTAIDVERCERLADLWPHGLRSSAGLTARLSAHPCPVELALTCPPSSDQTDLCTYVNVVPVSVGRYRWHAQALGEGQARTIGQ